MRALHVAKTYKVEWESTYAFNHQSYEFRRLLNELNVPVSSMSADDDDYLDFEVQREDWKNAISALKQPNLPEGVVDALNDLGEIDYVVGIMERCLKDAEPDEDWLHFSFF